MQRAGESDRRTGIPGESPRSVVVAIAVEQQIQASAGSDLDQRERPATSQARHRGEGRQQKGATPRLIGLHQPRRHQIEQDVAVVPAEGAEGRQRVARRHGRLVRHTGIERAECMVGATEQEGVDRREQQQRRLLSASGVRGDGE